MSCVALRIGGGVCGGVVSGTKRDMSTRAPGSKCRRVCEGGEEQTVVFEEMVVPRAQCKRRQLR